MKSQRTAQRSNKMIDDKTKIKTRIALVSANCSPALLESLTHLYQVGAADALPEPPEYWQIISEFGCVVPPGQSRVFYLNRRIQLERQRSAGLKIAPLDLCPESLPQHGDKPERLNRSAYILDAQNRPALSSAVDLIDRTIEVLFGRPKQVEQFSYGNDASRPNEKVRGA